MLFVPPPVFRLQEKRKKKKDFFGMDFHINKLSGSRLLFFLWWESLDERAKKERKEKAKAEKRNVEVQMEEEEDEGNFPSDKRGKKHHYSKD